MIGDDIVEKLQAERDDLERKLDAVTRVLDALLAYRQLDAGPSRGVAATPDDATNDLEPRVLRRLKQGDASFQTLMHDLELTKKLPLKRVLRTLIDASRVFTRGHARGLKYTLMAARRPRTSRRLPGAQPVDDDAGDGPPCTRCTHAFQMHDPETGKCWLDSCTCMEYYT